ncbi:MAG: LacI family DNA-binding transcriptional regulator [Pseudomonadota bacterium]
MQSERSVPTLDDVAKAAGVSTATVSRCLNSPDRVVDKTRKRVLQAVEELGYAPNFGARIMAVKRSFTIGAIVPTMENAIFARGLQAFQEELHKRGYTLLVASSTYQPDLEREQVHKLVSRGADGLLLIGHDRDPAVYEFLKNQQVPALVAWTYAATAPQRSVGFDNRVAMRRLADEILGLGHTRIGVISAARQGNDRVRQRIEGINDALMSKGLSPTSLNTVETTYDVDQVARAFDALMAVRPRPTVVICGNDVLAVGALRRAYDLGIKVPQDVSITGFDDIELARIVVPALTTVHVPHQKMGRTAAQELVDMVENKTTGASVKLETHIRIRESLAAPQQ